MLGFGRHPPSAEGRGVALGLAAGEGGVPPGPTEGAFLCLLVSVYAFPSCASATLAVAALHATSGARRPVPFLRGAPTSS